MAATISVQMAVTASLAPSLAYEIPPVDTSLRAYVNDRASLRSVVELSYFLKRAGRVARR